MNNKNPGNDESFPGARISLYTTCFSFCVLNTLDRSLGESDDDHVVHRRVVESRPDVPVVPLKFIVCREAFRSDDSHGKVDGFDCLVDDGCLDGAEFAAHPASFFFIAFIPLPGDGLEEVLRVHQQHLDASKLLLDVRQLGDGALDAVGGVGGGEFECRILGGACNAEIARRDV